MASTKCFSMFLFVIAIFLSTSATAQGENPVRMAPGLYVFGDSTVDSGNAYVGVNTPFGQNVADFIASLLGLPHALPYVSLTDEISDATIAGISFAVAGARILPETGQEFINDVLLTGVHFSVSNDFEFVADVKKNPEKYGITNIVDPCYKNDTIRCDCPDQYLYWDWVHTTEAANHVFAVNCFSLCSPLNIIQLVRIAKSGPYNKCV